MHVLYIYPRNECWIHSTSTNASILFDTFSFLYLMKTVCRNTILSACLRERYFLNIVLCSMLPSSGIAYFRPLLVLDGHILMVRAVSLFWILAISKSNILLLLHELKNDTNSNSLQEQAGASMILTYFLFSENK